MDEEEVLYLRIITSLAFIFSIIALVVSFITYNS
jgi:hypothetical protein